MTGHFYHHSRFYVALAIGVAVLVVAHLSGLKASAAAAGDAFFLTYLCWSVVILLQHTAEDLKRRAAREDEGILIVVGITLAVIAQTIVGVFLAIDRDSHLDTWSLVLILAGVPLGWFVLHTITAFHYANRHYFDPPGKKGNSPALDFPGTEAPDLWDFLYFAYVIGMTAQVSDVQIRTTAMRRVVTAHAIISFFFNTVLIALVVNAVAASH